MRNVMGQPSSSGGRKGKIFRIIRAVSGVLSWVKDFSVHDSGGVLLNGRLQRNDLWIRIFPDGAV